MVATGSEGDAEMLPPAISIQAEPFSTTTASATEVTHPSHMVSSKTTTSQPADKSRGKICGVCNDHEAKYKCSRCQLPYCSVACATLHRATHPAVTDDTPPTTTRDEASTSANTNGPTSKAVPGTSSAIGAQNPFSVLEGAKELHTLFIMYPRLRSQLRDIYANTSPPTDGSAGQYDDQAQSHGGRGRGRVRSGRGRERGPWNADRGTQDGIDALCNAKEEYGKGGEGVREYAELVLKLVSMEGMDVARLVQEEAAEENAKIIAQLLNGDSF